MYVPDNYDAYRMHEAEQAEKELKCPICCECGEYITDEHYFDLNGEYFCQECLEDRFMKWTDDYEE